MKIAPTAIDGLSVVQLSAFEDHRGSFMRCFCDGALEPLLSGRSIRQINHSRTSRQGALRGLHYQTPPFAEMKFVRCIRGSVYDVAVDLRSGSDTFLQHHAEELSAENGRMIAIPEGFAHGFQTLEPDCELLYLHTQCYAKEYEGGLSYKDPLLAIEWPLAVVDVSDRDLSHPPIDDAFSGITV